MKISDIKILHVAPFTEFYSSDEYNNGIIVIFMKRDITIRVFIDFGNNEMILQQIDENDMIYDYYENRVKLNFLKLFHDIAKMTKIQ